MSFPQRDFVHSQDVYSTIINLAGSALRLSLEDIQHRRFTQPFLESDSSSGCLVLHSLVDVHLEGPRLSPFGIDPLQVLSEGLAAHFTVKAPLRKMHQGLHPPHVQVAYTAILLVVATGCRLHATWADGYVVFMFTKQVQILLLALLFNSKPAYSHAWQTQQITQCFRRHRLQRQTIHSLYGLSRIFSCLLTRCWQLGGYFHIGPPRVSLLCILAQAGPRTSFCPTILRRT